jgi:hypothetical protein
MGPRRFCDVSIDFPTAERIFDLADVSGTWDLIGLLISSEEKTLRLVHSIHSWLKCRCKTFRKSLMGCELSKRC